MNFFTLIFQGLDLDFKLLFVVICLGIISWKGASRCKGQSFILSGISKVFRFNVQFNSIRYSLQYWNTQLCFNVVERCKFQRWRTQRYFNVDVTLCGGPTSYQPENNVETVLKCLLGINLNLLPKCVEDLFYKLKFISLWQIHHSPL